MGKRKHVLRQISSSSDKEETAKKTRLYEDVIATDVHVATITMANESQSDDIAVIKDSLKEVSSSISKIVSIQEGLMRTLDSKFDKLKLDLTAPTDGKINSLRDDLALIIRREGKIIDKVFTTIQSYSLP
ncbi:hypothetical protein DPMN_186080 [Dreissena polymorpha]|uniref:Uncharacterized protein n=1 Tax=Dreissena polymorpha TaxID=45954 RepID=A0A9D4DPV1_DREPO|nr:hypothetical protein DPMN_186080 [Dreissena polymorpha]